MGEPEKVELVPGLLPFVDYAPAMKTTTHFFY